MLRSWAPAAQFVLYALLVWFGCSYRNTWLEWVWPTGGFVAAWIDGPPSISEQLAMGISAPLLLILPLLELFDGNIRTGAGRELLTHTTMAIAVPVFWYWLCGRLGSEPRPGSAYSLIGIVCLVMLAAILVVWSVVDPESIVLRVFALLWIGFGVYRLAARRALRW